MFIKPLNTGSRSTGKAAGKKLGALLDALDGLDSFTIAGDGLAMLSKFRSELVDGLKAEGWEIKVSPKDTWKVTPPKR